MTEMTKQECLRRLNRMKSDKSKALDAVDRKRKWRLSEKAMLKADLLQDIKAIEFAAAVLEVKDI